MLYFTFFYNIILVLLFGVCLFGFLQQFFSKKKRLPLWLAVMFLFYIFDNLLFAMTEFIPSFIPIYQKLISLSPYLTTLIDMGMLLSFRMILAYWFDFPLNKREKYSHYIIAILFLGTTIITPPYWSRVSYRVLEQIVVVAITALGFYYLYKRKQTLANLLWKQYFWILTISAVLHLGGGIECLISVFSGPKKFTYRIISYELFGIFCAAVALYFLMKRVRHPASHKVSEDELLKLFISENKLTPREAELIPMLLSGASNALICEEKCISLNTVKVHTHNIYQKLGIERRSQMSAKFSEYKHLHTDKIK